MNYRQIYVMDRHGKALVIAMLGEREREREMEGERLGETERQREGRRWRERWNVCYAKNVFNKCVIDLQVLLVCKSTC